MFVGVVGSERNSRSKPPALIFIRVSFSGVISFVLVESVAMFAKLELCCKKSKATEV